MLKRFSITCYGHQKSIEEIRAEKFKKFGEFKKKKGTREYNEWFLSYKPYLRDLITKTETNRDDTSLKSELISELDYKPRKNLILKPKKNKIQTKKVRGEKKREKKREEKREEKKRETKKRKNKIKTEKTMSEKPTSGKTMSEKPTSEKTMSEKPTSEKKCNPEEKPEIEYRFW